MSHSIHDATLRDAVRHHETGRLDKAEPLYREILAADPAHVDAMHLLGVLSGQTSREMDAVALIQRAIALRPDAAQQHNNLGNVQRQMGKLSDAIESYRTAVQLNAGYARAWSNLGNALSDDGQLSLAIDGYRRSLELSPEVAEFHSNLGIALREDGQIEAAVEAHRRAIAIAPNSSEAFNNLGVALRDQGKIRESLAAHEQAVRLRPDSLSALSNLGAALRLAGRVADAIAVLERVLQLNPEYADAHNNLGSVLIDQGDMTAAAAAFRRALQLRPKFADAYGNLAIACAFEGRVDEAMSHARLAVQYMPGQPLAHWNLSMLLLLVGDFELGWREHEWRWKCPSMMKERQFPEPRWNGEDLNGRTILLFAEQGFGDTLQFIRYALVVAQCGGRVIVECQQQLLRLFECVPGISLVVCQGETLPSFDLQCPLMSVPFAMQGRRFVSPPIPYLFAHPLDNNETSGSNKSLGMLNVGLVWAGDPSHQNDRARSMHFSELSALSTLRGIRFHSLQKGLAATQAKGSSTFEMMDHSAELTDFAATASIIANLDVVIAVDTAVAHLSAALGKPTWVLLPAMPDWRWMLRRRDSEWYPTARLFRQTVRHEWGNVIENIAEALNGFR